MGNSPSRGTSKKNKSIKKKPESWFETCTVQQLKELCKACKQPVSGTKIELCRRLISHGIAGDYGESSQKYLKSLCKDKLLVQSGNKFDQVLRLLHHEHGTGVAKRAATETIVDDETGEEIEVIKKRKITPSPKTMYTRVAKKMNASTQKKYCSNYGSKDHSGDVYGLMKNLIQDHCIDSKIIDSDPMMAFEMSLAVFKAFDDNWSAMIRPGYDTYLFEKAVDLFAGILEVVRGDLNSEQVEDVVSLLESIKASTEGYCVGERSDGENALKQTILVVCPEYDETKREEKRGKLLKSDVSAICWLNDIPLP